MTIRPNGKRSYSVRKIVDAIRNPRPDLSIISAHRGARWNGIPENSKASIRRAADLGLACIEIDLRITQDGHVVVFHDDCLGRATDIGERSGHCNTYSPWTGEGYNPSVKEMPWHGVIDRLCIKDEHGVLTNEQVLDLDALLRFIHDEEIDTVIFLDIKGKDCIIPAYETIRQHTNSKGVPAMDWCIWKYESIYYPFPGDLEQAVWYRDAKLRDLQPLVIPVYEPPHSLQFDALVSLKAYANHRATISLEIGYRGPKGPLTDLVEYVQSPECPVKGMGYFATIGDLHIWDGRKINYDMGKIKQPWGQKDMAERYLFEDNRPAWPATLHGPDCRNDQNLYRQMGFSWVIVDRVEEKLAELEAAGLRDGETFLYE